MSLGAIRTGRYSTLKRAKKIDEVNALIQEYMEVPSPSTPIDCLSGPGDGENAIRELKSKVEEETLSPEIPSVSEEPSCSSSGASSQSPMDLRTADILSNADSLSASESPSSNPVSSPIDVETPMSHTRRLATLTGCRQNHKTAGKERVEIVPADECMEEDRNFSSNQGDDVAVWKTNRLELPHCSSHQIPVGSSGSSPFRSPSSPEDSSWSGPWVSLAPHQFPNLAPLYTDKERILQSLRQVDITQFGDDRQLCKEELYQQQLKHIETCHQKAATFGSLTMISEDEYESLYSATGIDIDNRKTFAKKYFVRMESLIRSMIRFARCIPGFLQLQASEQLELIKWSRTTFCFLTTFRRNNINGSGVAVGPHGDWLCKYEMREEGRRIFDQMDRLWTILKDGNLRKDEEAVMKAMLLMSTNQLERINSPLADAIYQQLYQLLQYTCRNNPPSESFTHRLVLLEEAQDQGKTWVHFFQNASVIKYSSVMKNPFYLALFSNMLPKEEQGDKDLVKSVNNEYILKRLGGGE